MSEKTIVDKVFIRARIAARKVPYINRIILAKSLQQRFPHEHRLLEGIDESRIDLPSVLHFSVNKAATQYVKSILFRLATENDLVPIGLHDLAFHSRLPYMTSLRGGNADQFQRLFRPKGYLYSVFSGAVPWIAELERYHIIVTIRDPRDILTSEFYSMAYSHVVPVESTGNREDFLARRGLALSGGIDAYACERAKACVGAFLSLIEFIEEQSETTRLYILKYEEMVDNYETWLDALADAAGLEIGRNLKSILLIEAKNKSAELARGEDTSRNLRKGLPGDFRTKLKQETIEYLNQELAFILKYFVYRL